MSWLSKGLKSIENWVANKIPHTSEEEKRASMQAAKEQIDYYKTAKEELAKERAEAEAEKKNQRQKIAEKELRGRKATYRRAGFLEAPSGQPKDTLG